MFAKKTARTASRVALIVGTALIVINYGDRILLNDLNVTDGIKMALTYCVPYLVSSYSAAKASIQCAESQSTNH